MASLSVQVPKTVALVAKINRAIGNVLPVYDTWIPLDDIHVLDLFCGSSIVGHSTAKLALSTGLPGVQIDVEKADLILGFGDRVAIGLDRGDGKKVDWQFCGYVVSRQLTIDDKAERATWKLAGPEFWWGDNSAPNGTGLVVRGQFHRINNADDAWSLAPATVTKYDEWITFTDDPAIFNPDGKKNMTSDDVVLSPDKIKPPVKGRIWEAPDRRLRGAHDAQSWDIFNAAKMLYQTYGQLDFAGIVVADWKKVPMAITDAMREVTVEGVGMYEALKRVLGNKFAYYVDPRPTRPDGKPVDIKGRNWGPFQLHFFRRTDGAPANLYLNARGTPMSKAKASVTRVEVASDISKSPNRVIVNGSYVRAIKLIYWGAGTPGIVAANNPLAQTMLQHAWGVNDAKIEDYGKAGDWVIDPMYSGITKAKRDEWLKRYHTKGQDFLKYWQVFRRFLWNEASELDTTKKAKYRATELFFQIPFLDGIADTPEMPSVWYRRPRKMMDTLYLRNPNSSSWDKHAPTLWMSAATTFNSNSDEWATLRWRKISGEHFSFDEDRCAVTFIVDDLAEWRPFDKQDSLESDDTQQWPDDPRTFASLLHEGVLRFCIECSVPVDFGMTCYANPTKSAGAPFPREIWIPAEKNFINTLTFPDMLVAPSGLTITPLDLRAKAQEQADLTRDAAQDEAIHASIMTAGDWDRQIIGSRIQKLQGRDIDLAGRSGGAQIVAVRLDTSTFKYEYLTESLALGLKDRERELLDKKAKVYQRAKRASRIPN